MSTTTSSNARTSLTERRRRQLEELADAVDVLPGSFVVPMRVLELHRSGTAGMNDYAEALCADSSLTGRILSLVNSPAFAPAAPVTRLSQAVTMIGLRNLMPLVFGTSLAGIFNNLTLPSADRRLLWRSSILKAIAAREYCLFVQSPLAEEAFLCGLMQDLGLPLIFASDRATWPEVMNSLDAANAEERTARELRLQGIEHGVLGERVVARLELPQLFREAVCWHHASTSELQKRLRDAHLAAAVQLAAELPHRLPQMNQSIAQKLSWRLRMLPGEGGRAIEPPAAESLVRRISAAFELTQKMLGDADENSIAFKEFMQHLSREVTKCLTVAIGSATAEITGLKTRESQMADQMQDLRQQAAQSDFDSLTGMLNRRGFDSRVPKWLKVVASHNLPCVLGYIDLDNFKQLNDNLGHAAGDAALVLTGRLLLAAVNGRGMVSRLGGDEFSFVFVPRGEQELDNFVERLKQELTKTQIEVEGQIGRFGASAGVLCLSAEQLDMPVEQAMRKADELMYTVKKNGKGRCTLARLDESGELQVVSAFTTPADSAAAQLPAVPASEPVAERTAAAQAA